MHPLGAGDGADQDRRIDRLGGTYNNGSATWNDTVDAVINAIGNGHTFWTMVRGYRVEVVRKIHPTSGRWYVTTEPDGFPPNNLLNLPHC
ncbi:DUF3892 domain-containing protein [Rhizorhabdus sp.]|uniref:DUF3892 domain-containing protein n=1 Tax=Rhizorhabdus sp. TaxID=1968843 RepID=UPI0035B452B2